MRREKLIRFFISSTFADMTIERDLLQDLLRELREQYLQKGWQIEYVDLRWGITKEAGYDNRTMQICMEELMRCQRLSPKPNFIVLLGERYGWRPLPEIVDQTTGDRAKVINSQLFGQWYKLDYNSLPAPVYVLQPRNGVFRDEAKWENDAYVPLTELFRKVRGKAEMSATEQEIQEGIMSIADARQHVTAYLRTFSNVPLQEKGTFQDNSLEEAKRLRQRIISKVSADNIYSETSLNFADYGKVPFCKRFKHEMSSRLRRVIDHTIEKHRDTDSENDIHLAKAEQEGSFFAGRKDELEDIDRYIRDPKSSHTLWIKSQSGAGKTALISQIVRKYKTSHNVICRFCGETDGTQDGISLFRTIWTQLWELYPDDHFPKVDLPTYGKDFCWFDDTFTQLFQRRLERIKANPKPLLILIDGINQLSKERSREFLAMKWADRELSADVKIIITSTQDYSFDIETEHIEVRQLKNISQGNAMLIVKGVLRQGNRKLDLKQEIVVERAVSESEKLPIYLTLLANYLLPIHSYDTLQTLPSDFGLLVGTIIDCNAPVD